MHPGVWLAFGDVNGEDFWRNKWRIEHAAFVAEPSLVQGRLVFATRSRLVAGMVRVGAAFEVQPGAGHADAALAVCVAAAASLAEHVLVFVGSDDDAGTHLARELGFVHVLDRVMLTSS